MFFRHLSLTTKLLAAILFAVVLLGGVLLLTMKSSTSKSQSSMAFPHKSSESSDIRSSAAAGEGIIAGTTVFYKAFTQQEYVRAQREGKIIVLNFYAHWCPICRAEEAKLSEGFSLLTSQNVVGFRVNWNDSETDEFEKKLAQRFKIPYQHTKVILKEDKVIYQATEEWDKETTVAKLSIY